MNTCLICQKSVPSKRGLCNHIRTHGITPREYKRRFFAQLHSGLIEGDHYLICPICGLERSGQLTRHLIHEHNLSIEEIKELNINLTTRNYSEKLASKISKAHKEGRMNEAYRNSARTKSANWTFEDTSRLYNARIASGCYSELSIKRNNKLIAKFGSYEDYLNELMTRLPKGFRGTKILGGDSHGPVTYRSTWEYKLSLILNKLNITYKYEPCWIKYYSPSKKKFRRYSPDFLLESSNLILEVKPSRFIDEEVLAKKLATEELGYKFIFITEDKLDKEFFLSNDIV